VKTRPGGHGVIVLPLAQNWRMRSRSPMKNLYALSPLITVHPVPYGTDVFRAVSEAVKLPGYHHLVPAGQDLRRPVHNRGHSSLTFEEDDDEYENELAVPSPIPRLAP
jgi:hypothetical protein